MRKMGWVQRFVLEQGIDRATCSVRKQSMRVRDGVLRMKPISLVVVPESNTTVTIKKRLQ